MIRKSTTILPCGVSKAPKRPSPGCISMTSVVTRPLRKSRALSPLTLTTPRSGRNAAFDAKISCDMLQRNVSRQVINDKTRARACDYLILTGGRKTRN